MPLKDDNFARVGKPEAYTEVIDSLHQKQEEDKVEVEYDLDLAFDVEDADEEE